MTSLKIDAPAGMNCTVPGREVVQFVETEEQLTEEVYWSEEEEETIQNTFRHVSFPTLLVYQMYQTIDKAIATNGLVIKANISIPAVGEDANECALYCTEACKYYSQTRNYSYIMTSTGNVNLNRSGSLPFPPYYCEDGKERRNPIIGVETPSQGQVLCKSKMKWKEYRLTGESTLEIACPDALDCTYADYAKQFQYFEDIEKNSNGYFMNKMMENAEREEEGVIKSLDFQICAAGNTRAECQRYCKKYCVYQDPDKMAKFHLAYKYQTVVGGKVQDEVRYDSEESSYYPPLWWCPKGFARDIPKPVPFWVWILVALIAAIILSLAIAIPIIQYRRARRIPVCVCKERKYYERVYASKLRRNSADNAEKSPPKAPQKSAKPEKKSETKPVKPIKPVKSQKDKGGKDAKK